MRAFLIVTLFGLLFLSFCGPRATPAVYNARGIRVGEIRLVDGDRATIVGEDGTDVGSVREQEIRRNTGTGSETAGTVISVAGNTSVLDARGKGVAAIMVLEAKDMECYDAEEKLLGRINMQTDPEAAGAACLLLLIPQEQ